MNRSQISWPNNSFLSGLRVLVGTGFNKAALPPLLGTGAGTGALWRLPKGLMKAEKMKGLGLEQSWLLRCVCLPTRSHGGFKQ